MGGKRRWLSTQAPLTAQPSGPPALSAAPCTQTQLASHLGEATASEAALPLESVSLEYPCDAGAPNLGAPVCPLTVQKSTKGISGEEHNLCYLHSGEDPTAAGWVSDRPGQAGAYLAVGEEGAVLGTTCLQATDEENLVAVKGVGKLPVLCCSAPCGCCQVDTIQLPGRGNRALSSCDPTTLL